MYQQILLEIIELSTGEIIFEYQKAGERTYYESVTLCNCGVEYISIAILPEKNKYILKFRTNNDINLPLRHGPYSKVEQSFLFEAANLSKVSSVKPKESVHVLRQVSEDYFKNVTTESSVGLFRTPCST
ncbi:hypothetical protein [Coleopteran phasma-related virus OKIAV235]|uniref:Uncharacterized protein n=1 Tax=Coleopteran phasma-related virus OKIAV235 TaxID=2746309 RepID=A0A7D7JIU5_9VIRU|nr:hypothetical protein QK675_sSgp1 [Coleopteran phasma-related virus OKIAV235]QMP82273.1 hypothetical protein [Coleopteran phasma-related virus OKIAV235]